MCLNIKYDGGGNFLGWAIVGCCADGLPLWNCRGGVRRHGQPRTTWGLWKQKHVQKRCSSVLGNDLRDECSCQPPPPWPTNRAAGRCGLQCRCGRWRVAFGPAPPSPNLLLQLQPCSPHGSGWWLTPARGRRLWPWPFKKILNFFFKFFF